MPRLPRRLLPRVVAATVAVIGALLVAAGALLATTFAPPAETTARLDGIQRQPVVATDVGLLSLEGPRVRVEARAPGRPVFLGIGRAADVDAYLGKVQRVELSGHDAEGALLAERSTGESALPDPAGVDVWAVSTRGQSAAELSWPETPGQWRLVAATDGTADGPRSIAMSWEVEKRQSAAPALVTIGLLMLVGGGVTLAMLMSRSRLMRSPE